MPKLNAARSAQYPLAAEFTFSVGDTMTNAAGALDNFSTVGIHVFDVIPLPPGATVIGGSITTDVAVTGGTFNVSLGDAVSDVRYLAATNRTAAGTSPALTPGYIGAGDNVRLTANVSVGAATTGKFTVRVLYTVLNRSQENQIA